MNTTMTSLELYVKKAAYAIYTPTFRKKLWIKLPEHSIHWRKLMAFEDFMQNLRIVSEGSN